MKLLIFEIKKLIFNKLFLIVTLLVLSFFAYMMYSSSQNKEDFNEISKGAVTLSQELKSGKVTIKELSEYQQEKFIEAFEDSLSGKEQNGIYCDTLKNDMLLVMNVISSSEYCSHFAEDMKNTVVTAIENMVLAENNGDKASEKYYDTMVEKYNKPKALRASYTASVGEFFDIFYSGFDARTFNVLLVLWTAFLVAYFIKLEKIHKTCDTIYSTKHGRLKLFKTKVLSLFAMVVTMCLFICLTEICYGAFRLGFLSYGKEIMSAPIQTLPEYQYCSMEISIIGYYALSNLLRLLALLSTASIALLISVRMPNLYSSAGLTSLLLGGSVYVLLWNFYDSNTVSKVSRMLYPPSLVMPDRYFLGFDYDIIGGVLVNRMYLCVGISFAVLAIFTIASALIYERAWKQNGR